MAKNYAHLVRGFAQKLPKNCLFAFNAGIDEVCVFKGKELPTLPLFALSIRKSFRAGGQKEIVAARARLKELRAIFPPSFLLAGGQAGNACQTASSLGVECLLHTHCKSAEFFSLFRFPERILVACREAFAPVFGMNEPGSACFRHLVIEFGKNRFIAAYDPHMPVVDWEFSKARNASPLPRLAYVGGFHLFKSEHDVAEAVREMTEWKRLNPKMKIHVELGDFQKKEVLDATRKLIFPLIDSVGLNEIEMKQLGATAKSLLNEVPEVLFHTQKKSIALPETEDGKKALGFASLVASFRAETGKPPTFEELEKYALSRTSLFITKPVVTVGIGDVFSCAWFLARNALR